MSRETFARGFCKAAEAYGVDPEKLAKAAAESTVASDYVLGNLGSAFMSPLALPFAYGMGYASDIETDESARKKWRALLPGLGSYRTTNRIRKQVKKELEDIERRGSGKDARPVAHAVSEGLGPITSAAAAALAGSAIGGGREFLKARHSISSPESPFLSMAREMGFTRVLARDGDTGKLVLKSMPQKPESAEWQAIKKIIRGAGRGARYGLYAAGAAWVVAMIAAAVKRRRTAEEQIESDKGSVLKKYLIPGTAAYDQYKRLGRSQGDREEADEAKKKKDSKK